MSGVRKRDKVESEIKKSKSDVQDWIVEKGQFLNKLQFSRFSRFLQETFRGDRGHFWFNL